MELCGHLKLIIVDENSRYQVEKILESQGLLSRHAATLTGHLEQALDLGDEDVGVYPNSSWYRPSIATHDQNPDHDDNGLNRLIDAVRDGYPALLTKSVPRAANLLRRWVLCERGLFQRLALHALTENPESDIQLAKKLLVSGESRSLGLGAAARGAALLPTCRCTAATEPARRDRARNSCGAETEAEESASELPGLDSTPEGIASAQARHLGSTTRQTVEGACRRIAASRPRR